MFYDPTGNANKNGQDVLSRKFFSINSVPNKLINKRSSIFTEKLGNNEVTPRVPE
jgi:hypothetical protein